MVTIDGIKINGIELLNAKITYCEPVDYECLYKYTQDIDSYLEIGSMYGASAIVAGFGAKDVYSIDPHVGEKSSTQLIKANWSMFHEPERLHTFAVFHPPLPKELEDMMFDVILIDGDHKVESVWRDWNNLKSRASKYILFHDTNYKGIGQNPASAAEAHVSEVFNQIIETDKDWEYVEVIGKMGVLKRL